MSEFKYIKNPKDNFDKSNIGVDEDDDGSYIEEVRSKYGDEFADDLIRRNKNGWTEWRVEDGVLKSYLGNLKRIEVPDGVTEIGDGAFVTGRFIEEIKIPDGVVKIGERAFGWLDRLEKIEIPDSVTEIGKRAFVDCGYLRKVKLSKNLQSIGTAAFILCSNLKEISIPAAVKSIGDYAFKDCIRLTIAEIDDAETSIGEYAFENCGFSYMDCGDKITEIGEGAFAGSSLFKLTIPASVKKIGKNIFEGCEDFFWAQCMPQSKPDGWDDDWNKNSAANGKRVKAVWNWGFTNGVIQHYDKTKFNIEGNKLVQYTGAEREIVIPDGVYRVAENAFSDCKQIEKLTIPASVKYFDDVLGCGKTKIKTVYFQGSLKEWSEIEFEYEIERVAEEIYVGNKRIK